MRGKGGSSDFDGLSAMAGLHSLSVESSLTKLYYSGRVADININTFTGKYYELNIGVDVGGSVGVHVSYAPVVSGGFVLGLGFNLGVGISSVYGLDLNFQLGTIGTKTPFRNKN